MDNSSENIEIETLVGLHQLTGVDMVNRQFEIWYALEDCQCINFVLDGVTYTAIEDPGDGYRSSMEKLIVTNDQVMNTFAPVQVMATVSDKDRYGSEAKILVLTDTANGKVVLQVGTENIDDYYPGFLGEWIPQNLSVNEDKAKGEG
jgi:hypothetical protein